MSTVLVVDDDPINREFLRTLLVYRGHEVREAADGDAALRLAGGELPDAIITDVLMPGLDGYELARRLRDRPTTKTLPIAFSTAYYGESEIRPMARACGVRNVIFKPARPQAVLSVIDSLLDSTAKNRTGVPPMGHSLRPDIPDGERSSGRGAVRLTTRLEETHKATQSGSWDLDPNTGLIKISRTLCELLRLPSSGLRPEWLWRHVHPDDLPTVKSLATATLRAGRPQTVEIRVVGPSGVVHELVVSCHLSRTSLHRPPRSGYCRRSRRLWGVVQDVTAVRDERIRVQKRADERAGRRVLEGVLRSMLPHELPSVTGADLAAAYLPAPGRMDIGTDWYDAVRVDGDRLLLSVGSVAGHDNLYGSTVMGPVRMVLRALAMEDPEPTGLLDRLNRFVISSYPDDTFVTAVVALYEPEERRLSVANAGHPAPLLFVPEESPGTPLRALRLSRRGPALGIGAGEPFAAQQLTLQPGTSLCAYTDGLTDPAVNDTPGGERRLASVVGAAYAPAGYLPGTGPGAAGRPGPTVAADLPPEGAPGYRVPTARQLLDHILGHMTSGRVLDDDVCLTVLRVPPGR